MEDPIRTFEVEHAGCSSCAALVREALEPLATVEAVDVDEAADVAAVRARPKGVLSLDRVNAALAEASGEGGHAYRVKPGSWQ